MLFKIKKASDWNYESEKEFNTLEELLEFVEECKTQIIIEIEDDCKSLMIYDDWIE